MKNIIFGGIFITFFVIFFKVLNFIWNSFIPWNALTDIISFLILVFVNIPLSIICTKKVIKVIKEE